MSTELYNSLFDKSAEHTGDQALVAALAQWGRIHRAAEGLADDEMLEGLWVSEEEEGVEQMRYAADERNDVRASYSGGEYRVDVVLSEDGYQATQVQGKAGASLKIDGQWVALTPNETVLIPISSWVDALVLVDLLGNEVVLRK